MTTTDTQPTKPLGWAEMRQYVGKSYRGSGKFLASCNTKQMLIRITDVTYGGDLVCTRNYQNTNLEWTMSQTDWFNFLKTAKEVK